MSEEEKKAIEWLKDCGEYWEKRNLQQNNQATTILNLVEKQQQKIKELKSQLDFIDEQNRHIDKLEKEIEEYAKFVLDMKEKMNNFQFEAETGWRKIEKLEELLGE